MSDIFASSINSPSLLSIMTAYIGGVFSSLTPCVYPMLPIMLSVIGASNIEKKSTGFFLSLSYALGLSVVYGALGMIAALTGGFFGEIATSGWAYLFFGNLCLLLAIWMMDWINIPLFMSGRATDKKGMAGAFVMGFMSGFVAAPCTSPVLGGLLLYVSEQKDIIWGGFMMLAFSFGLTTFLIIAGTASGALKTMPRPGPWMLWAKKGLAVILFAFSEFYLIKAGGLLI